jgi:hypothetical protein
MTTPFPFTSGQVLTAAQMNDITVLPINDQTASLHAWLLVTAGKRVIMNAATANTITVDDAVFGVGDSVFIANKGAGVRRLRLAQATINYIRVTCIGAIWGRHAYCLVGVNLARFFPQVA